MSLLIRKRRYIYILYCYVLGVPAISIPIKLSKKGLPISLQLIGRNLSEPMLLALAKYIEYIVKFPQFVNRSEIKIVINKY